MLAGNVAVERDTRVGDRIVAADRNLAFELPAFAVQRSAENLEQVHGRQAFEEAGELLLCASPRASEQKTNKSASPDDYS